MAIINCPECKREISDKAPACPYCGCPAEHFTTAQTTDSAAASPNDSKQALIDSEEVKAMIGFYYTSYAKNFRRSCSFNWSACLFNWLWFFYRKMYACGFLLVLAFYVILGLGLCICVGIYGLDSLEEGSALGQDLEAACFIWCIVWNFLFNIGLGFFANGIYKNELIRRCKKADTLPLHEREKYLRKKSGTSNLAVVLGLIFINLPINFALKWLEYLADA